MNHLNGWQTDVETYLADCLEAKRLLGTELYRPPYGRITWRQYMRISAEQQIVMWDVISGDFDGSVTPKEVIDNVLKNVRGGSIVTMHDSIKAMNALKSSMNEMITQLKGKGYSMKPLSSTEQRGK
jgi:peptidoglycan/xylan/chitin deacetylase (PgdA/CDA1 family)